MEMNAAGHARLVIRPAEPVEYEAAYRIYAHYIETTNFNWNHRPRPCTEFQASAARVSAQGRPMLVAVGPDGVLGFAMLHDFRAPDGYWPCVENSIYVQPELRGQGIGHRLMEASLEQARATGVWAIIAVIDARNEQSIQFHTQHHFRSCGLLENIGEKNGIALSAVFMQHDLPENRERYFAALQVNQDARPDAG